MRLSKLDKNKKYLLACSYGPDSMACFNLLIHDNINFDVAIVNYHLREESNLEVAGLEKYCLEKNKKLFIKNVEEKITKNIENRCREIRYDFFYELYKNNRYGALIVAHHQDDHIETYLLQLKRHILPKHYGLAPKSMIKKMVVIRPLLNKNKRELIDICQNEHVPYSIDKTNLVDDFERNKIRHQIVEKLSNKERTKLLKEIDNKNKELNKLNKSIKSSLLNNIEYMLSLDFITYLYAINRLVQKQKNDEYISKKQGQEIIKILKSDKPNILTKIKDGLYIAKEYDVFSFIDKIPEYKEFSYIIEKPCRFNCKEFYLDFRKESENRNVRVDDYPLTIRNAKEDDILIINGYEASVRRLFIDWKMPLLVRRKWPIILNKLGKPIYIPRYQKNFKKDENTNFYVKIK